MEFRHLLKVRCVNIFYENKKRIITSKNWEELGDISAIDVRLAALLCDRCGKSFSLSIR